MMTRIIALLLIFSLLGCKSDQKTKSTDLLEHGFAISIDAPADVTFEKEDYGIMKELTVMNDKNYSVQILKSEATSLDPKSVLSGQKSLVKSDPYFSKFIEENENSFIYEKKIDDRTNYDFRYVKIQGNDEYVYQTGLMGTYTEEDVRSMLNSVR